MNWIARALSDKGQPSSQRLLAFLSTLVLSGIGISLTIALMANPTKTALADTLTSVVYALAGLGGFTFVGARVANNFSGDVDDRKNSSRGGRKNRRIDYSD